MKTSTNRTGLLLLVLGAFVMGGLGTLSWNEHWIPRSPVQDCFFWIWIFLGYLVSTASIVFGALFILEKK